MKNFKSFKKPFFSLFLAIFISLMTVFCSCSNQDNIEESDNVVLDSNLYFQRTSSIDFKTDMSSYYKGEIEFGVEKFVEEHSVNTTEILKNGIVVGYFIENSGNFGIGDISKSGKIVYYDLVKKLGYSFDIAYNQDYETDLPLFNDDYIDYEVYADNRCQGQLMLCIAGCTLASIAIAASDGPLPFMDAVAVSTYVVCNGHCVVSYDLCVNPPRN